MIPARGGSKGILKKNIKKLLGKPLLAWTIEAAKKSEYIDKIIVSTENEEIAEISKKYGAEVPFLRPEELAKDKSLTIDAIFHALEVLKEQNYNPNIVILLQPTSPLRNAEDIDSAIDLFLDADCESVVSVCEVEHSPYWCFEIEKGYLRSLFGDEYLRMRRQDLEGVYVPNGAIYISTPRTLYKCKSFYCNHTIPYIMPIKRSIDIDNEIDFMLAESVVQKYGVDRDSNETVRKSEEDDE